MLWFLKETLTKISTVPQNLFSHQFAPHLHFSSSCFYVHPSTLHASWPSRTKHLLCLLHREQFLLKEEPGLSCPLISARALAVLTMGKRSPMTFNTSTNLLLLFPDVLTDGLQPGALWARMPLAQSNPNPRGNFGSRLAEISPAM